MNRFLDFFKALAGVCRTRPLSFHAWRLDGKTARVSLADAGVPREPGEAVYLKGHGLKHPILILRTGDGAFLAVQNRCTHVGGRKLDPVPEQSLLRCCSVGHSTFDLDGSPVSGPAIKPLTIYPSEERDGELIVHL